MPTTELITHPSPGSPTVERILEETADLVEFVPVAGPPAILLVGPLVLATLLFAGPVLALVTIVVVLIAAAAVIALAGAVLAAPYLVVRRLRAHASFRAPAPLRSARAVA